MSITSRSDRKSTRLNSSHTVIYTLSLHDALPILMLVESHEGAGGRDYQANTALEMVVGDAAHVDHVKIRSEEHTSELQSHSDLHSFPTRRSSDLDAGREPRGRRRPRLSGQYGAGNGRRRRGACRSRQD